jgi:hypothetical protein
VVIKLSICKRKGGNHNETYLKSREGIENKNIWIKRSILMHRKITTLIFSLLFITGSATFALAAAVPAPTTGGDGFKAVSLEEAKKLHADGGIFIACHSHTTDFMKGHPTGTIYIPTMVPADHKVTDMPLENVDFDISQLPKDKDTPFITYCASDT